MHRCDNISDNISFVILRLHWLAERTHPSTDVFEAFVLDVMYKTDINIVGQCTAIERNGNMSVGTLLWKVTDEACRYHLKLPVISALREYSRVYTPSRVFLKEKYLGRE